jgi:hypothetical protein
MSLLTSAEEGPSKNLPSDLLALPSAVHEKSVIGSELTRDESGKRVLAYIQLQKGKKEESWLLSLALDSPETEAVPEEGGTKVYSSTGREFLFKNQPGTLKSTLLGPLEQDGSDASKKNATISVNRENLGLGLNRLSDFFDAGQAIRERFPNGERMRYQGKGEPFPSDPILSDPVLLEEVGLTAEVERAFLGALPALLEFFGIIYETPGLNSILREMIPARRMLGMLNPFSGRNIGFSFGNPIPYEIDTSETGIEWDQLSVIPVELQLNEKTVMRVTLYTTEPEGPWETTAGVVMLVADSVPAGKSRMIIRCQARDALN